MLLNRRISTYVIACITLVSFTFIPLKLSAQVAEGINYQAVARDANNNVLANTQITVQFSIVANSATGTTVYQEVHDDTPTSPLLQTNDFGLFNLVIGRGVRNGGNLNAFEDIDWSSGRYFLRVEIAVGSNSLETLGTTELVSVPFALYAKSSGNTVKAGTGIQVIGKDSVINTGDLSESNELISSFSILSGNILRITEASTNYDVDLTPLLPASTDSQSLSFSSGGDSILIDNGNGIDIKFITDTIVNFNNRIIANQSSSATNANSITTNQNDITNVNSTVNTLLTNFRFDSIQTQQNQDSIVILTALIGNSLDNQNLSFSPTRDSILIENGSGIRIQFILDTVTDLRSSIGRNTLSNRTNAANIVVNQNNIITLDTDLATLETNFTSDSTQTQQNQDSIAILTSLIGNPTDNQNLSIVGDSIVIERGTNIGIGFITDSIVNYNTRIGNNANEIAINIADLAILETNINAVQTNFTTDSTLTIQNRDSINVIAGLIGIDNDTDSTNELIDSIRFNNRVLEIYQQGSAQTISFDTLNDSRRLALFNRIILNSADIAALEIRTGEQSDSLITLYSVGAVNNARDNGQTDSIRTNILDIASGVVRNKEQSDSLIANITNTNANTSGVTANTSGISTNAGVIGNNIVRSKEQSDSLITLYGVGAVNNARDNGQSDSIRTNILDIASGVVRNKEQSDSLIINIGNTNTNTSGISTNAGEIANNIVRNKDQSDSLITLYGVGAVNNARDNGQTDSIRTNILDIAAGVIRNKQQSDSLIANINSTNANSSAIATNVIGITSNVLRNKEQSDSLIANIGNTTTNTSGIAVNNSGISTNASGISTNAGEIANNIVRNKDQSDSLITLYGVGAVNNARDNGQTDSIRTNILDIASGVVRNKEQSDSLIANINSTNANSSAIATNVIGITSNVLRNKEQSDSLITTIGNTNTNTSGITANSTAIGAEALARNTADGNLSARIVNDSTNLVDTAAALRAIIPAASTDDQNITLFSADSIAIEDGVGTNISILASDAELARDTAFLNQKIDGNSATITSNSAAISTNTSGITTNIGGISSNIFQISNNIVRNKEQSDSLIANIGNTNTNSSGITANSTAIGAEALARNAADANLSTRIVNDSANLIDTAAALRAIIPAASTDDQVLSISGTSGTITLEDGGSIQVADSSASNEIQQLTLIGDVLRIDDPSGTVNPAPIDLSIYNTTDNLGNHQLDSNLRLGAFYISGDGDNEGLSVDGNGNSNFTSGVSLNSDQTAPGYPLSIRAASSRVLEIKDAVTNAVEWDINTVGGNLEFNETGVSSPFTIATNNRVGIASTNPDSTLTVNGGLKTTYFTMTDGAASGNVLTSDVNGVATWQALTADTISLIRSVDSSAIVSVNSTTNTADIALNNVSSFQFTEGNISFLNADNSVSVGNGAGPLNKSTTGFHTALGRNALRNLNSGVANTSLGWQTLFSLNTGSANTAIGASSMGFLSTGDQNTAVGNTTGSVLASGNWNTFIGSFAGEGVTSGFGNVIVGPGTTSLIPGHSKSGVVYLGYQAGALDTVDNRLFIDNSDTSQPLIYGNFAADSVKIFGTLGVGNEYAFPNTAGTLGQVLQVDGSGNAIWGNAASSGGVFEKVGGVIRDTTSDFSSDFVIGSPQLDDNGITTNDNRMFFDKSKGAIRAGSVGSTQWDDASVGVNSVAFGFNTTAAGGNSVVGGGQSNTSSGLFATVGGGQFNSANNINATVGGGSNNNASATSSTVGGGNDNTASGIFATVGGGSTNLATGNNSTIGGGATNTAAGDQSTIGGGDNNTATADFSTVVGGRGNDATVTAIDATIGGGNSNTASGSLTTIGGGQDNVTSGFFSTIGGGRRNTTSNSGATIAGGQDNIASGQNSAVSGGDLNNAIGENSIVVGGRGNIARGRFNTILGGVGNITQSYNEIALGTFNDTLVGGFTANSYVATDRLLVIGNGTLGNSLSNALVMLKNGNTTLNGELTLSNGTDDLIFADFGATATNGDVLTFRNDSAVWTSAAAATCPTGMTNVQGNICIETNERAASDWYDAAQTCTSLGYKLPTWSEWYGAATNAVLTNEINNWEWVSDGTSNTARKVGNTNLKNTANDDPETGSANFRCIFYR